MTYHPSPATISLRHLVTLSANPIPTTCFAWRFHPPFSQADILCQLRQTVTLWREVNFGMRWHTESDFRHIFAILITLSSRKRDNKNAFRYRVYSELPPRQRGFYPASTGESVRFCNMGKDGDPDRIRTCNLPLRRGLLYPVEPRDHCALHEQKSRPIQAIPCKNSSQENVGRYWGSVFGPPLPRALPSLPSKPMSAKEEQ